MTIPNTTQPSLVSLTTNQTSPTAGGVYCPEAVLLWAVPGGAAEAVRIARGRVPPASEEWDGVRRRASRSGFRSGVIRPFGGTACRRPATG